jgi:hypothetical protein
MGKGGMRWGAGRPPNKGKAEACMRLEAPAMRKRGALRPGSAGSWSWHNVSTGEHSGSISYRTQSDVLVLDYSLNGQPKKQQVPILRTQCNYGGTRPWFACPNCAARVAVLYLRRGGFYCRNCARVAYYSQSEDQTGRSWRKQQKAEAKLGKDWQRPKGMHKATRERLLELIWSCEEVRDNALAAFMARHPFNF